MELLALLSAVVLGAVAVTALSVFAFAMTLTAVFVVGSAAAVALCDSTSDALWSALALFASAQVGYALGLAALAQLSTHPGSARSTTPLSRRHFWLRK